MQLSVDIATMNAKSVLADRINGKLDSMTKRFVAKMGSTDIDTSVLEEIEGVGPKRRRALLRHFGGAARVSGAGIEEIKKVEGISSKLAEHIYASLHD